MKPLVERLSKEYADKVETRVYVDNENPTGNALAEQLGVQYVPTFVFVNADGTLSGQVVVGGVDESVLRERLDALK
jgi:protein-disulfide isomerase